MPWPGQTSVIRRSATRFHYDDLGSNLLACWDAERADLLTESGGLVSSWRDTVAASEVTQSTGASQPAYQATGFGGRPCLYFDGADDRLEASSIFGLPSGASPCEMYCLCDQAATPSDSATDTAMGYGNVAATTRSLRRDLVSGVNRGCTYAVSLSSIETTIDFTGRHLLGGLFEADQMTVLVDAQWGAPRVVTQDTATSRFRFGAASASGATNYWKGSIALGIITQPLSNTQRTGLIRYGLARIS